MQHIEEVEREEQMLEDTKGSTSTVNGTDSLTGSSAGPGEREAAPTSANISTTKLAGTLKDEQLSSTYDKFESSSILERKY